MAQLVELEKIKKTAIVAMFADDDLMDLLVLKGGNAIDMIYQVNARASVDLDFSTHDDLNYEKVAQQVHRSLRRTFELEGYLAFDITTRVRPGKMPEDLAAFWGGYLVEFKLISLERATELDHDSQRLQREAIRLGKGTKFTIDISRHEYVEGKQEQDLLGYQIFVYSPEMIVCEKLRAICQQMPAYGEIIHRKGVGKQRARDFVDIEALIKKFDLDLGSDRAMHIIEQMFLSKKVPLTYLSTIESTRDFHRLGFEQVVAAMKDGVVVKAFDEYFDFVLEHARKLEPLWNV